MQQFLSPPLVISLSLAILQLHIQLAPLPQRAAINFNRRAIHVRTGPARQVHNHASDILRLAQPPHRVRPAQLRHTARQLQQPIAHLAREEARADAVDRDPARAQLHRQVPPQVQHRRLARAVPVRALLAQRAHAQPRHARRDDHPARVVDARALLQQRRELADQVEHAAHVEVHDLGEGAVRVRVEGLAPRGARIGEEDVDVVRLARDEGQQVLDALERGRVGGDRDGAGARAEVGQRVEGGAGRVAGRGFAGGDEDFGGAGLEEAVFWGGGEC